MGNSLIIFISTAITTWIGHGILRTHRANQKRNEFNQNDWKINGLVQPAYLVQFINNVVGGNLFAYFMLKVLKMVLIEPAVRKSVAVMKLANKEESSSSSMPKILCDEKAQREMQERLEYYYEAIMNSTILDPFGKIFYYVRAVDCLESHAGLLKLVLSSSSQIQAEKIIKPVIIVSIPRTGTTILHRTMALDRSQWRNFDGCDIGCPLPYPAPRWDDQARQIKQKQGQSVLNIMDMIYPKWMKCMETMHDVRSNEADEDMRWCNIALGHPFTETIVRLYPSMQKPVGGESRLESKELARHKYAWLKLMMQLHQHIDQTEWQKQQYDGPCPNHPWLLKDPIHSAYLPELLETFPDARLIFTHRPPSEVVPSFTKLGILVISSDFLPGVPGSSSKDLAAAAVKRVEFFVNGIVEFTKQHDESKDDPLAFQKVGKEPIISANTDRHQRIDLGFRDVMNDVPGTIDIIYEYFFGTKPTKEAKDKFDLYLKENEREKVGNQPRSLEDFDLTLEELNEKYREYNDLFLTKFMDH